MTQQPLWNRILKALELSPMSQGQLSVCLSTSWKSVSEQLDLMARAKVVRISGYERKGKFSKLKRDRFRVMMYELNL